MFSAGADHPDRMQEARHLNATGRLLQCPEAAMTAVAQRTTAFASQGGVAQQIL